MVDSWPSRAPRTLAELHEFASRPSAAVNRLASQLTSDVLVLGAGGKMGLHLTALIQRALQAAGSRHQVIAVSRFGDPGSTAEFERRGIAVLRADLTDPVAVAGLPDSRHVFFLAGAKFGTRDDPQRLQQMNVEVPRRVAQRYDDSQVQLVALSTGCVYGFVTPASGGSREADPLEGPGAYAQSCVGRERSFAETSARVSLVRLNYSVDLRYGVLVDVAQQILAGNPVDLTTGFVNVIWQGDAVRHIFLALQQAGRPPWIVNVTGARILPVEEIGRQLADRLGREVRFVGQPQPTAWLNNASHSHQLWGPPEISEDRLLDWVAEWVGHNRPTLDKPTQFQVRDGNY